VIEFFTSEDILRAVLNAGTKLALIRMNSLSFYISSEFEWKIGVEYFQEAKIDVVTQGLGAECFM
jgi:hypothetical protein